MEKVLGDQHVRVSQIEAEYVELHGNGSTTPIEKMQQLQRNSNRLQYVIHSKDASLRDMKRKLIKSEQVRNKMKMKLQLLQNKNTQK